MVADQPATQADQDRCPRRPSRPRHHLPTGRGGRHRPDGTRQIRNISDHYADVTFSDLRFREAVFPPERMFMFGGDIQTILTILSGSGSISFPNRYREDVAGLQPEQIFDVCAFIMDPAEGDVGRYIDQLGGFETVGWDIDLTVRLGTFVDTDREITVNSARDRLRKPDRHRRRRSAGAVRG